MNTLKISMIKQIKLFVLILISLIVIQSCKEVKSKNISGEMPYLILPTSLDTNETNTVFFKWEEMTGATKYRLQIAGPSFSNISSYPLDTIITGTSFTFALDSGEYELKLVAMNSGYTSKTLGPILFWVGGTEIAPPTTETLVLTTPEDESYINPSFNGKFKWNALTNATSYEFQLRKGANFENGIIVRSEQLGNALEVTLELDLIPQNKYWWRVMAFDSSAYITQTISSFTMDTLVPQIDEMTAPVDNATITTTDNTLFTWTVETQSSAFQSPNYYVLKIASDASFSSSTILFNESVYGLSKSLDLSPLTSGTTYFWRLEAKDDAGNEATPTTTFEFTIQ